MAKRIYVTAVNGQKYRLEGIMMQRVKGNNQLSEYGHFMVSGEMHKLLHELFSAKNASYLASTYSMSNGSLSRFSAVISAHLLCIGCNYFAQDEVLKLANWVGFTEWRIRL